MSEPGWLDRNVPDWTSADGLPDDITLTKAAAAIGAPDPDSRISKLVPRIGADLDPTQLGQLEDWKQLSLGNDGSSVTTLMDTTTLYTVYRLLIDDDPRTATPLTIMDLATFLTAFCVYDRICFLQNRYVSAAELNSLFQQEVFCELPVRDTVDDPDISAICGDISGPLKSLYQARAVPWLSELRAGHFGTVEQRRAWVRSWEALLGHRCNPSWLLRDPNEGKSHVYWDTWDSPAPDLLRNIVDVTGGTGSLSPGLAVVDYGRTGAERSGRVILAQESNARAIYNLVLADFLTVPYSASVARLPTLNQMAHDPRANIGELLQLPRAARELNKEFDNKAAMLLTGERDTLRLPFFPTAILQAAHQRKDIASVAVNVRDKGAAFRRTAAELNRRLEEREFGAAEEIKRLLEPGARDWSNWISAGEAGSVSFDVVFLLQEPHINALVLFAILLKGAFDAGLLADLIRRRLRPRYYAFGNLVLTPRVGPDVERLWHIGDSAWFTRRIQELAALDRNQ